MFMIMIMNRFEIEDFLEMINILCIDQLKHFCEIFIPNCKSLFKQHGFLLKKQTSGHLLGLGGLSDDVST